MRVRVSRTDFSRAKADLAACFAYEGDRSPRLYRDAKYPITTADVDRLKESGTQYLYGYRTTCSSTASI